MKIKLMANSLSRFFLHGIIFMFALGVLIILFDGEEIKERKIEVACIFNNNELIDCFVNFEVDGDCLFDYDSHKVHCGKIITKEINEQK